MAEINDEMIDVAKAVPIYEVLQSTHIELSLPEDTTQQFSCPLHGDGKDQSKSARYYPDNNSTYCWACAKGRDSIAWYSDFHQLDFKEAVVQLCRDFASFDPVVVKKRPEIEGKLVIDSFEGNFRSISHMLSLADRIALSQTLDQLWQVGCSVESQRKVEDFIRRKRDHASRAH